MREADWEEDESEDDDLWDDGSEDEELDKLADTA